MTDDELAAIEAMINCDLTDDDVVTFARLVVTRSAARSLLAEVRRLREELAVAEAVEDWRG